MYEFQHPLTGEIFEDLRSIKNRKKPFVAPDGVKCKYMEVPSGFGIVDKNAEVWEKDAAWVRSVNPRFVRRQDGIKIPYDPTKHC